MPAVENNITGFVRKSGQKLPHLNYDRGDIEALKDFLPPLINAVNAFDGDIPAVNWIGFENPELNRRLWELCNPEKALALLPLPKRILRLAMRQLRCALRPALNWLRAISG